jgi:intracellular sulfur oxidation DsrE/DsrF family protein
LKARNIDPKRVQQGARIVPSGVAEIGRLQAKEDFAYIKP